MSITMGYRTGRALKMGAKPKIIQINYQFMSFPTGKPIEDTSPISPICIDDVQIFQMGIDK